MQIGTVSRMISGDELKERNGFFIRRGQGRRLSAWSRFTPTEPGDGICRDLMAVQKVWCEPVSADFR